MNDRYLCLYKSAIHVRPVSKSLNSEINTLKPLRFTQVSTLLSLILIYEICITCVNETYTSSLSHINIVLVLFHKSQFSFTNSFNQYNFKIIFTSINKRIHSKLKTATELFNSGGIYSIRDHIGQTKHNLKFCMKNGNNTGCALSTMSNS